MDMDLLEPMRVVDATSPKGKYCYSYIQLGHELNSYMEQGGSYDAPLGSVVSYLLVHVPENSPMFQILVDFVADCKKGLVKKPTCEGLYRWLAERIDEGYASHGDGANS